MQLEVIESIGSYVAANLQANVDALPRYAADTATLAVGVVWVSSDDEAAKAETVARSDKPIMVVVAPDGPTRTVKTKIKTEYSYGVTPIAVTIYHRGSATGLSQRLRQSLIVARGIVNTMEKLFAQDQDARSSNEVVLLQTESLAYGAIQDDGAGGIAAVVFTVHSLDKYNQRLY